MALAVELRKQFPGFSLDVAFEVPAGVTVLFGRSGSGKTTTLRLLAGLLRPDGGEVAFDGDVVYSRAAGVDLPPQHRRIGYVFQDHSLYPHLTILDNIAFGARAHARAERLALAQQKVKTFRLDGQEHKYPHQVSGGQRQRAAIARAIIGRPRLLLLDEPFSSIDGPTRMKVRDCLVRAIRKLNLPVVLVTHDLIEAFTIGETIIIYEDGKVIQQGAPGEIIRKPLSEEVKALTHYETGKLAELFGNR